MIRPMNQILNPRLYTGSCIRLYRNIYEKTKDDMHVLAEME